MAQSIEEKADLVAEATLNGNSQLNLSAGREGLKQALSEKLVQSHDRGSIDLDKFLSNDKNKERTDRGEGRDR